MADDSTLNGLDAAANNSSTGDVIKTQQIKSDSKVIGGINLGAIDSVQLSAEDLDSSIDSAVNKALNFKPIRMKSGPVLSAAARLRQDFLDINPYIKSRTVVVRQIEKSIGTQHEYKGVDKQNLVDSIIMERNVGIRLDAGNKLLEAQLQTSANILKFNRTTASVYMRHSLALQYRQEFVLKDLLKVTKAFAEMAENKLEAIKINTGLPEIKKKTILDRVKDKLYEKGVKFAGKHAVAILAHETPEDVVKHFKDLKDDVSNKISSIRKFSLSARKSSMQGDSMPTGEDFNSEESKSKASFRDRLREGAKFENLWKNTKMPRGFISDFIKKTALAEEKQSPEQLLANILAQLKTQTPGMPTPQMSMAANLDMFKVTKQLFDMTGILSSFKSSYETNFAKIYDLNTDTNKILNDLLSRIEEGGSVPSGNGQSSGQGFSGGTGLFSKIKSRFTRNKKYMFADIYKKDFVNVGYPLVSKEQFLNGTAVDISGKPIKSIADIRGPVMDLTTGNVLISQEDIESGLVDVNNKSFGFTSTIPKTRGLFGAAGNALGGLLGVYGSYLRFTAKAVGTTGNFIFRSRDRSPYVDVYVKGKITLGRPLVTGEKFRQGLVFADGSRVLNVNQIDKPVIDPSTGQTLITEEDIHTGLVDVYGKSIQDRKSSFSTLGGLFDVAKFGIKTAGSLAKPILGMYAEMFKIIPKAMTGVGSLISKALIGLFSGNPSKNPGSLGGGLLKGILGIAGGITSMYSNMFGFGLKGVGSVFGRLFGDGKASGGIGNVSKKDIYDLISVRLDHIYKILELRLPKPIRVGSYRDHENRLAKERAGLLHVKDDDSSTSKLGGLFGKIAGLFGMGGSHSKGGDGDHDDNNGGGGSALDTIAETTLGDLIFSKIPGLRSVKGFLGKGLKKLPLLGRLFGSAEKGLGGVVKETEVGAKAAVHGVESAVIPAAETVLKAGARKGFLKGLFKAGGKSLAKKLPGFGAVAGGIFAIDDLSRGDYEGAALDAASGLASLVPGPGTAASIAIDGYMAYRGANALNEDSKLNPFLKARLKIYGAPVSIADNIIKLEKRAMDSVISKGAEYITDAEIQNFAKLFGFDPKDQGQLQYFTSWVNNRFRNGYLIYLATLIKYKYNVAVTDDTNIKMKDQQNILSDYNSNAETVSTNYKNLIPTPNLYKSNKRAANAAVQTAASTQPVKPPTAATPSVPAKPLDITKPTNTSPTLPITKAAYIVPPTGSSPNTQLQAINDNGTTQIKELTYTPTNNNSPGAVSNTPLKLFNGASLPGASPGGIQPSIQTQLAATRGGYVSSAQSSGGTTPTGHAYFGVMYNALLAAAKAQGVPNPEVVAQLGAAQTSLETGYGQHVPGNNAFGIKGVGPAGSTSDSTQEFENGRMVTKNQGFRKYNSVAESAADYITFLKTNPRYKGVLNAKTIQDAVTAQANSGYATDPNYGSKLASIVSSPANAAVIGQPASVQLASTTPSMAPIPQSSSNSSNGAGPTASVMAPIKSNINVAENTQQSISTMTQQQTSQTPTLPPIQAVFHPDTVTAMNTQATAAQNSLAALGNIHNTITGLYNHLKQVHGPDGVFNTIAENTASNGQGNNTVIAPVINAPQAQNNNCQDNVGFSVKKKRDNRYNV